MNNLSTDTPCQCPNEGWCTRHQRKKIGRIYELCQTRSDYRRMWDMQSIEQTISDKSSPKPVAIAKSSESGPGTILSKFYSRFGIKKSSGCSCSSLEKQMNAWGPAQCRVNLEHIVNTIETEAKNRKLHFGFLTRKLIKHSVLLAISKSENLLQK